MLQVAFACGWVGPRIRSGKSTGDRSTGGKSAGDVANAPAIARRLTIERLSNIVSRLEEGAASPVADGPPTPDTFLSEAWRGGSLPFSAAVEASVLREGAYSWSMERLKDSQGAYAWSKDVVLQAQSLGQQRLQSLGLLPEWLTRSVKADEGVAADKDGGETVWAAKGHTVTGWDTYSYRLDTYGYRCGPRCSSSRGSSSPSGLWPSRSPSRARRRRPRARCRWPHLPSLPNLGRYEKKKKK